VQQQHALAEALQREPREQLRLQRVVEEQGVQRVLDEAAQVRLRHPAVVG